MTLTSKKLAEYKAAAEAATEGDWTLDERRVGERNGIQRLVVNGDITEPVSLGSQYGDNNRNNLVFASVAREAVPALVAEVERLQKLVDSYQGAEKAAHNWSPRCASGECSTCRDREQS